MAQELLYTVLMDQNGYEGRLSYIEAMSQGQFRSALMSLQLQVNTLLEGAGGDHALTFLDALSQLTKTEQAEALKLFTDILEKHATGDERFSSPRDQDDQQFVDGLYRDLLGSLRQTTNSEQSMQNRHLRVVRDKTESDRVVVFDPSRRKSYLPEPA